MSTAVATVDLCHLTSKPRMSGWLMSHLLQVEAWLDARESRQALYRMDERALADIGLTPADVLRPDPVTAWHAMPLLK